MILSNKQIDAFFTFLGIELSDIAKAINYLEREGLEPDRIEIPRARVLMLNIDFVDNLDRPQVSAPSNGIRISTPITAGPEPVTKEEK